MNDPDQPEDQALAASASDASAFGLVYERLSEPLLAYFFRRTFDADAAVELTAETLAVAFERSHRYRPHKGPARAWVFGIAKRELGHFRRRAATRQRALRRLGIEVPPLDDESIERISDLIDAARFRAALADALGQLSKAERDAIQLRVIDDEPYSTVADQLGCSQQAARVRVHRGLTRLNHLLEHNHA